MSAPTLNRPYWLESAEVAYPPLATDLDVDVAVIGAGITGVTAAYLLKQSGKTVALLEQSAIGHGATGYTTAKLTVGHSLIYRDLVDSFDVETARSYARSNQQAIERIAALVEEHGIDCDFERASNFVYTEAADRVEEIEREAEAARSAGIETELTTDTDLPYPVLAAVRVDDQAQFHPWKFIAALARLVGGDGSRVFELTRANERSQRRSLRGRDGDGERPCEARRRRHAAALPRPWPLLREGAPDEVLCRGRRDRGGAARDVHQRRAADPVGPVDPRPRRPPRPDRRRRRAQARSRFRHARALRHARGVHARALRRRGGGLSLVDARLHAGGQASLYRPVAPRGRPHPDRDGLRQVGDDEGRARRRDPDRRDSRAAERVGRALRREAARPKALGKEAGEGKRRGRPALLPRPRPEAGRARGARSPRAGVARVGAKQYAVYRDDDGQLHAFSARCTHLGCIVGTTVPSAAKREPWQGPATADLPPQPLPGGNA